MKSTAKHCNVITKSVRLLSLSLQPRT